MRALSKIFVIASLVLVACGGGNEDTRPGPLASRLEMMHIADIAPAEQQAALQAQMEWNKAQAENAKAESDYNAITSQLTVVRNDREKAKLQVSSAVSNKNSAAASNDTNKINAAEKELRTAELAVKAADARIRYYDAYRQYLLRHWRYAEENMYWKESQFELAKAQLAQKHNKAPKGVTYGNFPPQEADRNKRTANAKGKVEAEKQKAAGAREAWLKAQQTADQASGTPSSFPDPMLPALGSTTGAI
jgi:hypothetical protein